MKEFTLIILCLFSNLMFSQSPVIDGDEFICMNSNGSIFVINNTVYDSYQWYKKLSYEEDAVYEIIPGATGPLLSFDASYNEYYVKVVVTVNNISYDSNEMLIGELFDFGIVIENIFDECVAYADEFGFHVCEGNTIQLNVLGPLYTYSVQWYKDDEIIPGATNPTLEISESGYYYAICSKEACPLDFKYSLGSTINFIVCEASNDDFDNSRFSIFPNPTSDFIHIVNTNNDTIEEIEIYDSLGKRLITTVFGNLNVSVDVSNFASGAYLIKVKSKNVYSIHKFVKN